ncbi:MAG: hypothetical protein NZ585_14110 [Chloracidobacterium sp.]|nr:hypothetical protein [Chloracidobacterium sp.]MDW8216870.1 hypothetical protein [Acidobacteriota bacterium]
MAEASYKARLRDLFGKDWCDAVLTGDYFPVLPCSIQDVDLTAVLPTLFYLFRFGRRRGQGRFAEVFGERATVEHVAARLATSRYCQGFDDAPTQTILGDLLLGFCLENRDRSERKDEPIQRALPVHYFASRLDLPPDSSDLRYVPEMLVALLADQPGPVVEPTPDGLATPFPVGARFRENLLLKPFVTGVTVHGLAGDLTADRFDETTPVTLQEWLMIRLADLLERAPKSMVGRFAPIVNRRPLAARAARVFRTDLETFMSAYGETMPRGVLLNLLESALAIGMTTLLTSTAQLILDWAETGSVPTDQHPMPLFLDASNGRDQELRAASKKVMDEAVKQMANIPAVLMTLRLLDYEARCDAELGPQLPPDAPDAHERINLLGDVWFERRVGAGRILDELGRKALRLAEVWADDAPMLAKKLRAPMSPHARVRVLAETLVELRGTKQANKWFALFDSCLLCDHPRGLAVKRAAAAGGRQPPRLTLLTDDVLDYLAHLWCAHAARRRLPATFNHFLNMTRERYGFYTVTSPSAVRLPGKLLNQNQQHLEMRLRDLGLLASVSDAEAMKRLQARFVVAPLTTGGTA